MKCDFTGRGQERAYLSGQRLVRKRTSGSGNTSFEGADDWEAYLWGYVDPHP